MEPVDRDEFKKKAAERIRDKLPISHSFKQLVSRELSDFGDHEILLQDLEDAYNVSLDDKYSELFKSDKARFVYHQYIAYPNHGAELAATFRDHGLPYEFEVSIRASAVQWNEEWPEPAGIEKDVIEGDVIAKTVEYAMIFDVGNEAEVDAMLRIVEDLFTEKEGQDCKSNSWAIPDVRIVGIEKISGTEEVVLNNFLADKIIILAKSPIPGVEYKKKILVNKSLAEVIK
jgi:hypothetical protein